TLSHPPWRCTEGSSIIQNDTEGSSIIQDDGSASGSALSKRHYVYSHGDNENTLTLGNDDPFVGNSSDKPTCALSYRPRKHIRNPDLIENDIHASKSTSSKRKHVCIDHRSENPLVVTNTPTPTGSSPGTLADTSPTHEFREPKLLDGSNKKTYCQFNDFWGKLSLSFLAISSLTCHNGCSRHGIRRKLLAFVLLPPSVDSIQLHKIDFDEVTSHIKALERGIAWILTSSSLLLEFLHTTSGSIMVRNVCTKTPTSLKSTVSNLQAKEATESGRNPTGTTTPTSPKFAEIEQADMPNIGDKMSKKSSKSALF
ncbi:hypothetical protein Tco_0746599, partial [Tanacetum coccineum]